MAPEVIANLTPEQRNQAIYGSKMTLVVKISLLQRYGA